VCQFAGLAVLHQKLSGDWGHIGLDIGARGRFWSDLWSSNDERVRGVGRYHAQNVISATSRMG
jgi:hypothetical protein